MLRRYRIPPWLAPLALSGLAALLLLPGLGGPAVPLNVDEGYNGVDALRSLRAGPALFYGANNGREPLYVWTAALTTGLLGPSAFALRLPAALAGIALVAAVYGLARVAFAEDGPRRARRVAALAGLAAALSSWAVHLGRTAVRVNLFVLLLCACVGLLWHAMALSGRAREAGRPAPQGAWLGYAGAGLCLGLGAYSYLPARATPLFLALVIGLLGLRRPAWLRAAWPGLALVAALGLLVALPLLRFLDAQSAAAGLRVAQVSLPGLTDAGGAAEALPALLANLRGSAAMFFLRGDPNPLYNLDARPVFPPLGALLFALGLLAALKSWRDPARGIWLLWLAVYLLPGVLSDRSPHFARQAGVLPAAWILMALGADAVWRGLERRLPSRSGRAFGLAAVLLLALALGVGVARAVHGPRPAAPPSPAALLDAGPAEGRLLLAAGEEAVTTSAYLAGLSPRLRAAHGQGAVPLAAPPLDEVRYLVERDWYAGRARDELDAFSRRATPRPPLAHPRFEAYALAPRPEGTPEWPATPALRSELGAELLAYDLPAAAAPGETLRLRLRWRVGRRAPDDPTQDPTFFVHLLDAEGRLVAQDDWLAYPVWQWRAGDEVVSGFDLAIPAAQPCGPLRLEVGFYSRVSGDRYPLYERPGGDREGEHRLPDDRALFGSVEVCGA